MLKVKTASNSQSVKRLNGTSRSPSGSTPDPKKANYIPQERRQPTNRARKSLFELNTPTSLELFGRLNSSVPKPLGRTAKTSSRKQITRSKQSICSTFRES